MADCGGAFKVTPWPFMTHKINTGTNEGEKEEAAKRETLNRNLISLHDCFVTLIRVLFPWKHLQKTSQPQSLSIFCELKKFTWFDESLFGIFFVVVSSAHAVRLTQSQHLVSQSEIRISIFDGKSIKIMLKMNTSLNIWIDSIRYWTRSSWMSGMFSANLRMKMRQISHCGVNS